MNSEQLRRKFQSKLDPTINRLNQVLRGERITEIEHVMARIGRGGKVPHWYADLRDKHTLPNLDGKTIGSVIEMLLLGVLETFTFASLKLKLRINPARGTDLPDLDLGVKSPSTNYCTSEPFFSAYERLIGSKHDAVILLTDYQEQKDNPPLKLQIIRWRYLKKTEIADEALCKIGLKNREHLLQQNEVWAQKMFRFLAFINQSDWRAKQLLRITEALTSPDRIPALIGGASADFISQNKKLNAKGRTILPDTDLEALQQILKSKPVQLGVIDALDNWVHENLQEAGRMPGSDEWKILKEGPLNGKIGMSFALQWRFNFGRIFNGQDSSSCTLEEFT
jgi:hypothetical protein